MPTLRVLAACLFSVLPLASTRAGDKPLCQTIDAEIAAVWQREKITAAPRCDDSTFLRRIYLDLVGTIPTYDEAKKFLPRHPPPRRRRHGRPGADMVAHAA